MSSCHLFLISSASVKSIPFLSLLYLSLYEMFPSVQFSLSVVSDPLRPHELQHARPPCPSLTPGVYPNPCPLSQWWHLIISSSVIPFSSCLQSFPTSGSFQISQHQVWMWITVMKSTSFFFFFFCCSRRSCRSSWNYPTSASLALWLGHRLALPWSK